MQITVSHKKLPRAHSSNVRTAGLNAQRGIVLIMALIILVVISLLAVTSLRNAGSSEAVAGNVRTTELASQAADIALRHCESSAVQLAKNLVSSDPNFYSTTITVANIAPVSSSLWQSTATWDSSGTSTATLVIDPGTTTYQRPPECMVELLGGGMPDGITDVTPSSFVITARGFGPEVPAGHGRPVGTVVWLQSTKEITSP